MSNSGIWTVDDSQQHYAAYEKQQKDHRKQQRYHTFVAQTFGKQTFVPSPMIADVIDSKTEKQHRRNHVSHRPILPNFVR